MGGFWARLVQSVKAPLKKVLGLPSLFADELATVLTRIEAILNSRPLTFVYGSNRDPEPLSPADLLIGYNI